MQRTSTILFSLALLTGPALAQSNDDILKRLDALEKENSALRARVNKLEGPPVVASYEPVRPSTVTTQTEMKPTAGYDAPPAAPLAVPTKPIDQWSGIYWGGSFGGGFTHSRVSSNERFVSTNTPPLVNNGNAIISNAEGSDGGALADIYLGVNQQIAPSVVVGVQLEGSVGDISFDGHGSRAYTFFNDTGPTGETAAGTFRPHVHSPFMLSALARAGWLADPTTMLYGLAGWTGAQVNFDDVTNDTFFEPKNQFWANGLTVGGGVEKKLSPNWSTRLEYRYTHFFASDVSSNFQFSDTSFGSQTNTIRTRFSEDMQMGRIGISYLLAQ